MFDGRVERGLRNVSHKSEYIRDICCFLSREPCICSEGKEGLAHDVCVGQVTTPESKCPTGKSLSGGTFLSSFLYFSEMLHTSCLHSFALLPKNVKKRSVDMFGGADGH